MISDKGHQKHNVICPFQKMPYFTAPFGSDFEVCPYFTGFSVRRPENTVRFEQFAPAIAKRHRILTTSFKKLHVLQHLLWPRVMFGLFYRDFSKATLKCSAKCLLQGLPEGKRQVSMNVLGGPWGKTLALDLQRPQQGGGYSTGNPKRLF